MILVCSSSRICWTHLNIETISNDEKCAISHLAIVVLCSLFFSWSWTHDFYIFLRLPLEPHGDLKWNYTQVTHFMKLVFDGSFSDFKCINHFLLVATPLWASVRMKLTLPKVGTWSPPGLPKIQNLIAGVKTPCIGMFFIPLERSWSVNAQNGLAWTIWTSEAQVMGKRRAGSQIGSLTPDH